MIQRTQFNVKAADDGYFQILRVKGNYLAEKNLFHRSIQRNFTKVVVIIITLFNFGETNCFRV